MAEVILSTEDVIVIGGPSSVSISLDVGATGEAGSMIYYGSGNPNSSNTVLGFVPRLMDMYINLDPTDAGYQFLYQYQNVAGVNEWVELFRMFSGTFRENTDPAATVFVDGSVDIYIPLSHIAPVGVTEGSSPADLNVQYSIVNANPVISSMEIAELFSTINSEKHLKITINAAELVDGILVSLEGGKVIHLFITMV